MPDPATRPVIQLLPCCLIYAVNSDDEFMASQQSAPAAEGAAEEAADEEPVAGLGETPSTPIENAFKHGSIPFQNRS